MAIVIEEERKQSASALIGAVMWIIMLGVIGAAIYYVFFTKPDLVELAVPAEFANTAQISKIDLKPEEVLSNPAFRGLKQYITPALRSDTGRPNPFLPL